MRQQEVQRALTDGDDVGGDPRGKKGTRPQSSGNNAGVSYPELSHLAEQTCLRVGCTNKFKLPWAYYPDENKPPDDLNDRRRGDQRPPFAWTGVCGGACNVMYKPYAAALRERHRRELIAAQTSDTNHGSASSQDTSQLQAA